MTPDPSEFATTFVSFMESMKQLAEFGANGETPLGRVVQDYLGVPLAGVDPILEQYPQHQAVDLDGAAAQLRERHGGALIGVSGPARAQLESFMDYLVHSHWRYQPGPVAYTRVATGTTSDRRVVALGISMLTMDGVPLVVLQRGAQPQYGRPQYSLEVLCPEPAIADSYLWQLQELMAAGSVLRGQVISFQPNDFEYHDAGSTLRFLDRPDVSADQVILPDGVLERIARHVVGIGERRQLLLDAGQHLKRGVLLYGPPGTGKTHVVRHLLSRTPGTTAVLLSGKTLGLLNEATKLARANQPAIVVLEDCDLVAEERGGGTNAVLFETLEAMDGLDGDADLTFILTTNRPDLLERALVERPGRVDLAIHIDKPDRSARRRLLGLYAAELSLSDSALDGAADRTEGTTASFTKELARRCILRSVGSGRPPGDDDLSAALDEMLSEAEAFTYTLLGGGAFVASGPDDEFVD